MKPIFWLLLSVILSPVVTFALMASPSPSEPTIDEWVHFLMGLKGLSGFGALGIAAAVVQGSIFLFRSHWIPLEGKKKLMLVQALTIVSGVIALRTQSFDWFSSFIHANTLGAVQVFLHQVYKQFTDKGDRYEIPSK